MTFLNRALKIQQNINLNVDENNSIANTFNNFGCCHARSRNCSDALTFLKSTFEIQQNISLNADENNGIADTLHNIGTYHVGITQLLRCIDVFKPCASNLTKGNA